MRLRAALVLVLAAHGAGCGDDSGGGSANRCRDAFAEAATVPESERRPDLLYDAAVACEDVDAWVDAAADHRDVLGGRSPRAAAEAICQFNEDTRIYNSGLCRSLGF
jgi:hypothetical protein